jgi:hypothetical protein
MAIEAPTVTVFFGLTASADLFFVLDDDVRGELDNVTYLLGGDLGTDITDAVHNISIRRGRNRELDEITTGTCNVGLRNFDRAFDPVNAAGPYFGNLRPGKQVQVSIYGVTIYTGAVDDWAQGFAHGNRADASLIAVDSLGRLARRDFDEWTTTGGQTAGPRIVDVLNRTEVGWGANRDIGTGVSTLQADVVSWGSNVLNYLQLVAKSDQGRLFDSRSGVLTFRDRHSVITATLAASFADDDTAIGFSAAQPRSSSELFFNRVSVDREGGVAQTKTDTAAGAHDDIRALSIGGLLLDDDAQSADMAEFLLNLYKEPDTRLAQLTIPVHRLEVADQAAVARIELGDVVNVVWTPAGVGAAIDADLIVEGVEHEINKSVGHVMRLALSNTTQRLAPFILDDDNFGVLDQNVLTF